MLAGPVCRPCDATDREASMGETVRRRFNYPVEVEWSEVPQLRGFVERTGLMDLNAAWELSDSLQMSDVSHLMTYETKMEGERGHALCLNGPDGDFRVESEPGIARVRIMGERVWLVDERVRAEVAPRVGEGDVAYAGPISGRTQREILALLHALVRALAGATGVFHDELRRPGGWDGPAGGTARRATPSRGAPTTSTCETATPGPTGGRSPTSPSTWTATPPKPTGRGCGGGQTTAESPARSARHKAQGARKGPDVPSPTLSHRLRAHPPRPTSTLAA